MLGFFTDPYPDELIISSCARFSDRMRFPNSAFAVQEFFGTKNTGAIVDLPSRLNYLARVLPPNSLYTSDRFIDYHTLAPLFSPFLPLQRTQRLREDMKQENGINHAHGRVGLTTSQIKTPSQLRFCPVCAREDKERVGERYWHRVHQISGIDVCPFHAVFLEASNVPWQDQRNPSRVTSAEKAILPTCPRQVDLSNPHHTILLKLARDTAWLLNWHGHDFDIKILRERYYNLLLKHNLAYYNGRIKTADLSQKLVDYYSLDFLRQLQCDIKNPAKGWVYCLVHTNTLEAVQHPLRHLLLITFFGLTAQEFFTSVDQFKPFGDGPWPCLNHASDHYGQLLILECRITDNLVKKKRGRPMGTFSCECGFVYNRIGPDQSEQDRLKIGSVQSYGPVWEKALIQFWKNTDIFLSEAASVLGVSELTVVRHAIRLNLPMNEHGARRVSPRTIERYKNFRPARKDALRAYRRDWLDVRKANPRASRNKLIEIASFLYMWLRKNDTEWLETHSPQVRKTKRQVGRVDWGQVDKELSLKVKISATRIKNLTGKPVRASLAEIIREIGHRSYLEQRLDKLPRTAKALAKCVESLEAFLVRKIKWAEYCYGQEDLCPSQSQFIERAGVANKTGRMPSVQGEIESAMSRLRRNLGR